MPRSTNRTLWPVGGGAVGFQPGWFPGHSSALIYINLGDTTTPGNFSLPMQTVFGITGPSNTEYPGSVCMPQVPLPANYTAVIGQNATIQVIETAQHGAALYNVSRPSERGNAVWLLIEDCSVSTLRSPIPKRYPKSTKRTAPTRRISVSNTSSVQTVSNLTQSHPSQGQSNGSHQYQSLQ